MRNLIKSENLTFTPEALQLVLQAFDEAWAIVERHDGVNDDNRDAMRVALAKRIVELSASNAGDPQTLRDTAVASFGLKKTGGEATA
jgi:hypothetical protein